MVHTIYPAHTLLENQELEALAVNTRSEVPHNHNSLLVQLRCQLRQAGCFQRKRVAEYLNLTLLSASYVSAFCTLLLVEGVIPQLLGLIILAYTSVHVGLIAHEASHGNISTSERINRAIGFYAMNLLAGISYERFKELHGPHHNLGNWQPLVDHPANFMLMGFFQKIEAIRYIFNNPSTGAVDRMLLVAHYALWLIVPVLVIGPLQALLNYLILTLLVGPYSSTLYFITHEGMSVIDPSDKPSFLIRHLISTRNLGNGPFHNLILGGVNHHVAHHIAPTIPRTNLAKATGIVREFCRLNGLPYVETSSGGAFMALLRRVYRPMNRPTNFGRLN
jgi:fatty acid desaturase